MVELFLLGPVLYSENSTVVQQTWFLSQTYAIRLLGSNTGHLWPSADVNLKRTDALISDSSQGCSSNKHLGYLISEQ